MKERERTQSLLFYLLLLCPLLLSAARLRRPDCDVVDGAILHRKRLLP